MNVALLRGPGFSRWAAQLPVARERFDLAIEPWGQQEDRKLALVKSLKESWDAAHPEGQAEQFIADAMGFPGKNREAVLWYITRRLSEGFTWKVFHAQRWRRHVLMIDENRESELKQSAHNKALHLTAIPLHSIEAGELCHWPARWVQCLLGNRFEMDFD